MRYFAILFVLGLFVGCGDEPAGNDSADNSKTQPKKDEPKKEEPKNEEPKKDEPVKKWEPKSGEDAGKSTMAPTYACPESGCDFTDPGGKGKTCLKHGSTQLKELWYSCDKCSKKDVKQGKCEGCGGDLKRTLK